MKTLLCVISKMNLCVTCSCERHFQQMNISHKHQVLVSSWWKFLKLSVKEILVVGLSQVCKIFVSVCLVSYGNLPHFFFFFLILMLNAGIQNPILKLSELILILFVNYLKFLKQNPLKLNICISFYKMIYIIRLWGLPCAFAWTPLCSLGWNGE